MPLFSKNLIKYSSLDNPSEKANSTHSELNSENHDQDSSSMSNCESSISGSCNDPLPSFYDGLIRLTQSFQIFEKAMANKCGGNSNLKFAWHAGSKQELCKIVERGFGKPKDNGLYGHGVYFSPDDSAMECLKDSVVDEDGMQHLLLCCLILGKTEVVHPGSDQYHPSSEEFDSGVDNLTMPKHKV
ncbi:hypothetical protein Q3G72_031250 [Acer saccharum]|nr:hypothetical protein Q3G72_031250 [Acer saccharum]